jgi:GT2 family glycosyltransferase
MQNSSTTRLKKVTVVIPNWNGMRWLGKCLQSLNSQDMQDFDTLVVDNGSTDESVPFIKENFPKVEVACLDVNTGFANAANIGILKSTTPYVALLNTDTEVYPDWLATLLRKIEISPPEIAAITSQMLKMDDPENLDDAGDTLSWYGAAMKRGNDQPATAYADEEEVFSPCAGACLYRKDFLSEVGGFDPAFGSYLEDVDLGLRGRLLGYRYLYLPSARVLHKSHGSNLKLSRYVELITRNRLLLFTKNIPLSLLVRHAPKLLYGMLYFFCAYAKPGSSFKGYLSFIASLSEVIKKRRKIIKNTKLDNSEIDAMLNSQSLVPPISFWVKRHVSSIWRRNSAVFSFRQGRRT